MSKGKVSEKMQRAVRKLQYRIANPNQPYHNLSATEAPLRMSRSSSIRVMSRSKSGAFVRTDSDSDSDSADSPPSDVPAGFLAVYVGRERQRFVISANNLNHAVFRVLLEKSAEEYGFEHKGGLPIACEVVLFEHLLWLIETNDPVLRNMEIDELLGFYAYS